jgi:hypothetical protein
LAIWALTSVIFFGVAAVSGVGGPTWFMNLATNAVNWLIVCVLGAGGIGAMLGGVAGKRSVHHDVTTEEPSGRVAA